MLTFDGLRLPGLHAAPQIGPPQVEAVRTKFFGIAGESEIRGQPGGRPIQYACWVFDAQKFRTAADLYAFLDTVDDIVDRHGKLVEDDANGQLLQSFAHVTFDGFQRLGAPVRDVGGLLGGGFWIPGILYFYDLGGK